MGGLTADQRSELDERGFVRVPSVVSAATAASIEDRIWAWMASRDGIRRDDRSTWPDRISKLQALRKTGAFNEFINDVMVDIAERSLGTGWHQFGVDPQALLSFPTTDEWNVPHTMWHFDLPARGFVDQLGALRCLGFVSDVGPRGGGTLVVEGSHELVRRMVARSAALDAGQSRDVRRELDRTWPWFADLSSPGGDRVQQFMTDGGVADGVPVRVVELTGRPGDVVVMHPWMLHNISMNVAGRPRMMTSFTLYAAGYQPFASTADH